MNDFFVNWFPVLAAIAALALFVWGIFKASVAIYVKLRDIGEIKEAVSALRGITTSIATIETRLDSLDNLNEAINKPDVGLSPSITAANTRLSNIEGTLGKQGASIDDLNNNMTKALTLIGEIKERMASGGSTSTTAPEPQSAPPPLIRDEGQSEGES